MKEFHKIIFQTIDSSVFLELQNLKQTITT